MILAIPRDLLGWGDQDGGSVAIILTSLNRACLVETILYGKHFDSPICIADFLLLYRCFMIWGRQPYVAIASSILLIADTVWGWIGAGSPVFSLAARFAPVYYWTVFATNIIMTAATAGRIYYMANIAAPLKFARSGGRRYHTAIGILVESGAVYSFSLLALILSFGNPNLRILFAGITIRLVAIMPTLMIVQVKLGRSIPKCDAEISMGPATSRLTVVGRGTVGTVVNIHQASRSRHSFDSDVQPRGPGIMITHTTHKHTDSLPDKDPESQPEADITQQKDHGTE
ncbi:unnamed protein product [Cyclocybe aegerita]|uniref:Uncharacterized protein n=1 Tax=Cyclocybe aegerita TaxID=1973307 RepID=A0A8S0XIA0_CYCAE|nr:unnamed protein product [Cyclocybe aegerita]